MTTTTESAIDTPHQYKSYVFWYEDFNCTVAVAAQQSNPTATSSGGGPNIPDIPIVSEPDYPERVPTVPSLGGSIFTRTHGTNERSNKLAVAPLLDVSSSGADDDFFTHFFFKSTKKKRSFCVWCLFA